ncbi:MAG: DUF58 domain-containing protein [Kiritimatiellia bacterium]|jgi:uncharacterized protein (DUF58 family)
MPAPSRPLRFLDADTLRAIQSLELRSRLLVEGMYASRHRCPSYGFSVEFKDYREYTPGDEPRIIDWKLLARTERTFVRRFEMESDMKVVVALDTSASMGYRPADAPGRLTKFEFGCTLSAALAYLASRQQDAAGLVTFDEDFRVFVPPRQGQRHLYALLSRMADVVPSGKTDLPAVLHKLALRLGSRGMVVLVSDLHGPEERVADGIRRLSARGHDVIVFHLLDEDEESFPFQALARFRDLETGREVMCDPLRQARAYRRRVSAFRSAIRSACLSAGADYQPLSTAAPIETVLRDYLLYRRRFS